MIINDYKSNHEDRLKVLIEEYNTVNDKITALSLKFASGSYLIPIGLILGVASINFNSVLLYFSAIIMPIILLLYFYNHVRYMALQFKLSGYCRYLEEKITIEVGERRLLLWESHLGRHGKQGVFEFVFLGAFFLLLFIIIMYLAYAGLHTISEQGLLPKTIFGVYVLIPFLYHFGVCSLLFFLMFFTNVHDEFYKLSAGEVKRKGRKTMVAVIVTIIMLALTPLALYPLIALSKKNAHIAEQYDYYIVLGNRLENEKASQDMKNRIKACLSLIENNSQAVIVVSGGNGEAEEMKRLLRKSGVDDKSIIIENQSKNTVENIIYSNECVRDRVLIVTSDYHVFRTRLLVTKMGIDYTVYGVPSQMSFIRSIYTNVKECYFSIFSLMISPSDVFRAID